MELRFTVPTRENTPLMATYIGKLCSLQLNIYWYENAPSCKFLLVLEISDGTLAAV